MTQLLINVFFLNQNYFLTQKFIFPTFKNPISHNILQSFVTRQIIDLKGLLTLFRFEFFDVFFFFEMPKRQLHLLLHKKKI